MVVFVHSGDRGSRSREGGVVASGGGEGDGGRREWGGDEFIWWLCFV